MNTSQPESKPRHRLTGLFRWERVAVFVFLLSLLGYFYWPRPLSVEERQFVGTWEVVLVSQPEFTNIRTWKFSPDRTWSFVSVIRRPETAETPATQRYAGGTTGKWNIRDGKLYVEFDRPRYVYAEVAMLRTLNLVRTGALGYPLVDEAKLTYESTKNTCDVAWRDFGTKSYNSPKEWTRVSGSIERD